MLQKLFSVWRARHVLIVGKAGCQVSFTQLFFEELGAKVARIPGSASSETLCRALNAGRINALIVPEAHTLCTEDDPFSHLQALSKLLIEAREAGVPLVILCSDVSVYRARQQAGYAREEDMIGGESREGLIQSLAQMYACGVSRGLLGYPVRVMIVRHMPALGSDSPETRQYDAWCRSLLLDEVLHVMHPAAQGVFQHPLDVVCPIAALGARFWDGQEDAAGVFNIGAGAHNLCANRSAALRLIRRAGGSRPISESNPPFEEAIVPLDGSRVRLLLGQRHLLNADDALDMRLEQLRAEQEGTALSEVMRTQTQKYLTLLA